MAIDTARYRGPLPPVVYGQGVVSAATAPAVSGENRGKAFLVSTTASLDSAFVAQGATPGAIGWINTDAYGDSYVFRRPVLNDIVVLVAGGGFLRYETRYTPDLSTGQNVAVTGWYPHKTVPERALQGMEVFDLFDPAGVYDYYARLIGAPLAQLQATNDTLRRLRDPYEVPSEYLDVAAASVGVTFDDGDPEGIKRNKLAAATPAGRMRGLDLSIRTRLRQLGYVGYVTESWRAQDVAYPEPLWHGGRVQFANNRNPTDGQTVTVGVTGYGSVTMTFRATATLVTDVAIAPTPQGTIQNFVTALQAAYAHTAALVVDDDVPAAAVMSIYECVSPVFPELTLAASAPSIRTTVGRSAWNPPSLPPGWPSLWLVRVVNDEQFSMRAYSSDGTDLFPYITAGVRAGSSYRRSRGIVYFYDQYAPVDGDVVEMTVGGATTVFEFDDDSSVTPGRVPVPFTAGAPSATIMAALSTAVGTALPALNRSTGPTRADTVVAGTGESGSEVADSYQTWIEVFHGTRRDEPLTHTPSPMLSIHLNNLDGTPLALPDIPPPALTPDVRVIPQGVLLGAPTVGSTLATPADWEAVLLPLLIPAPIVAPTAVTAFDFGVTVLPIALGEPVVAAAAVSDIGMVLSPVALPAPVVAATVITSLDFGVTALPVALAAPVVEATVITAFDSGVTVLPIAPAAPIVEATVITSLDFGATALPVALAAPIVEATVITSLDFGVTALPVALSGPVVAPTPIPPSGAFVIYTFDDDTCNDTSGNGKNGTVVAGSPTYIDGKWGDRAVRFDGNDAFSTGGYPWFTSSQAAISFGLWMRKSVAPGVPYEFVFTAGVQGGEALGLDIDTPYTFRFSQKYYDSSFVDVTYTNPKIIDGDWHHVVCIYRRVGISEIYFDGVFAASAPAPSKDLFSYPGFPVRLGGYSSGTTLYFYIGDLDDFRVFKRALTLTEIQAWAAV